MRLSTKVAMSRSFCTYVYRGTVTVNNTPAAVYCLSTAVATRIALSLACRKIDSEGESPRGKPSGEIPTIDLGGGRVPKKGDWASGKPVNTAALRVTLYVQLLGKSVTYLKPRQLPIFKE